MESVKKSLFCFLSCLLLISSLALTAFAETETSASASAQTKWWNKFGEPEYGGSITVRTNQMNYSDFDPINLMAHSPYHYWLESLFIFNWIIDREIYSFPTTGTGFTPQEYMVGWLAESWEQTDLQTWTIHLRQGIHWSDKPPVNGRELTADDVQYTFDRLLGTGSGFTEPNPLWRGTLSLLEQVIAIDKYTVVFKLKKPTAQGVFQIINMTTNPAIVPREWIEQGNTGNWKSLVGIGPWMAADYVQGVSITCNRNPDYVNYDERHPDKHIPYMDTVKEVAIADNATALAAMRTGKLDLIPSGRAGSLNWQQAKNLISTNPEIRQAWLPAMGVDIELRCDTKPFSDIRVRKALQMALDRPTIAKSYYGGTVDGIPCGVVSPLIYKGWVTPFEQWPESLKDEYRYNPTRAKQLLAEAAADGTFEPNERGGFDTNIIASTTADLVLLQILKDQFMDIGVDMEIKTIDAAAFRSFGTTLKHDQMIMSANIGMSFTPPDMIQWRSSTNLKDNWTLNNDAKYDAMVEEFYAATDLNMAKSIFNKADLYLLQHHWAIQVCPTTSPVLWQPYFKGYSGECTVSATERGYYWARCWVDQKLKETMGSH